MCVLRSALALASLLFFCSACTLAASSRSSDTDGGIKFQHTADVPTTDEAQIDIIALTRAGRRLTTTRCGETGKKCCAGRKPCREKKAGCIRGTCRLPCGDRNMPCCYGYNGYLDYTGTRAPNSKPCNPSKGLVCYNGLCKACGKLDRPCCRHPMSCNQPGTTCDAKNDICVACGGLNQRCCKDFGPPCNDPAAYQCKQLPSKISKCVPKCGGTGQPCCKYGKHCYKNGDKCVNGKCVTCGESGKACCPTAPSCNNSTETCVGGKCMPPPACGGPDEPCCSGAPSVPPCRPGYSCTSGKCKLPCGGLNMPCCTGAPGELDLSGGATSDRGCNRTASLTCKSNKCVHCGDRGETCCMASSKTPVCNNVDAYCNEKAGVCAACGGLTEKCCPAPMSPCMDANSTVCNNNNPVYGKCAACGDIGQRCCAGTKPCATPESKCVDGKCKPPCGGVNLRCCHGDEGCDNGLTCYQKYCRKCGTVGQLCCTGAGDGCSDSKSTCDNKSHKCVACGGAGQKCCVDSAACRVMPDYQCSKPDPADGGVCVKS